MRRVIYWWILIQLWIGGGITSVKLNVQRVGGIRLTFVPQSSVSEVEVPIGKVKMYKSPGADPIPAELIQAGGGDITFLRSTNLLSWFGTKNNCPTSRRNQLSYLFIENGDKNECSNYRGISLLPTSYKILSNILSRLIPYADEIIGEHQRRFRRKRLTTDQIFYIRHILEKKWGYNGIVHHTFQESLWFS
jgi:hypothetical protein